jgi:hypothetical protein
MEKKPRRTLNVKTATAATILEFIESWASDPESKSSNDTGAVNIWGARINEAEALWFVLSALRGPDGYSECAKKSQTTVHIREVVLHNFTQKIGVDLPWPSDYVNDMTSEEILKELCDDDEATGHFDRHIANAARAVVAITKKK